jgi:hypothetical protein
VWNLPNILKDVFYVQARQKISLALNDVINNRNNYFSLLPGVYNGIPTLKDLYLELPGVHTPFYRYLTPEDRFNAGQSMSNQVALDGN